MALSSIFETYVVRNLSSSISILFFDTTPVPEKPIKRVLVRDRNRYAFPKTCPSPLLPSDEMVGFSSRPTHRHPPLPLSIAFPDSVDRFDASHGRLIAGATNPRLGGGAVPPLPCPSSPVVRIIEAELTRRGIRAIIAAVLKSCCDRPIRTRQKYLLLPSHGVCVFSARRER